MSAKLYTARFWCPGRIARRCSSACSTAGRARNLGAVLVLPERPRADVSSLAALRHLLVGVHVVRRDLSPPRLARHGTNQPAMAAALVQATNTLLVWFVAVWGFCFFLAAWPVMTVLANLMLHVPGPWRDLALEDSAQWAFQVSQVASFYLMARLCVIFPATALDQNVNLRWAWNLTRKNGWRLVLVVGALPWILSHMVDFVYRGDATTLEAIALTFLGTALFAVEISAVSLAYLELIKGEEPAQM